jgi:hypothetical protein
MRLKHPPRRDELSNREEDLLRRSPYHGFAFCSNFGKAPGEATAQDIGKLLVTLPWSFKPDTT